MLTEEKTTEATPQPELFASGGAYYIMDRRTKKQDEPPAPEAPAEESAPPISSRRRVRKREINSSFVYLLAGFAGAAAGAAVAVLYPIEGAAILSPHGSFLAALADRLLRCGGVLAAEYILGYFAAGGLLVWMLPPIYGLGAGLIAAACVMSGSVLPVLPLMISVAVISLAAARSADFSSLLLSVAAGRSGSIVTDGNAGSSYTMKFCLYLMALLASAIAEALLMTING